MPNAHRKTTNNVPIPVLYPCQYVATLEWPQHDINLICVRGHETIECKTVKTYTLCDS